ncbi:unnamed protein product [Heligmosomoides polygyrus]|uniref:ERGIC_N domain-containing protein n=1 Tax=Heligmosomoides polygyrus TaxID=6339 RepID=A0A183F536_HELPZ|nr:unnamed protein product [Heligmosomoides polygyrus]
MGICRSLHLTFTEEQILAIIGVLEAGADPSALAEWLAKVDEAKRNTGEASSQTMSLFTRLRELDAYSKPMEDFRVKTLSGGMVSLVASVAITVLAVQETYHFFSGDVVEQLYVDSTSSDVRVNVRFDVTFHYLPCPCQF